MASHGIGCGVCQIHPVRARGLVEAGHGEQNWHGRCKHVGSACRGRHVLWGLSTGGWASVYRVVSVVAGTCRMTVFNRGAAIGSRRECQDRNIYIHRDVFISQIGAVGKCRKPA